MSEPAHVCRFVAGTDPGATPLVLLHGTYGDEDQLLPLAGRVSPGAAALGVRGTVPMDEGYAFFRRLPNRRVDEADLGERVPGLAGFIASTWAERRLERPPVAVGFSNGAIMAAALLLTRPGLLAGAILFRPLSPFTDDLPHRLDGTPVLILDGADDERRDPGDGLRLAERLRRAGAVVTHHELPTGHRPTDEDVRIAREWLRKLP